MRTLLTVLLSAGLVAGCAPLLEDLQAINANLRKVNYGSSSSTPEVHAVTATVDNVCNQPAFEEAFRRNYIRHWNDVIRLKEQYYQLVSQRHPTDAAAQHNYVLYRGKKLEEMKYGTSDYGVKLDDSCMTQSSLKGEIAGNQAASQAIGALESREM